MKTFLLLIALCVISFDLHDAHLLTRGHHSHYIWQDANAIGRCVPGVKDIYFNADCTCR